MGNKKSLPSRGKFYEAEKRVMLMCSSSEYFIHFWESRYSYSCKHTKIEKSTPFRFAYISYFHLRVQIFKFRSSVANNFQWLNKSNRDPRIPTIWVKIYWEFGLFPRFSKFEVRARKCILGYLFNLIEYFNLGGDWQTSRLYSEPYWTILELLDPQILRS